MHGSQGWHFTTTSLHARWVLTVFCLTGLTGAEQSGPVLLLMPARSGSTHQAPCQHKATSANPPLTPPPPLSMPLCIPPQVNPSAGGVGASHIDRLVTMGGTVTKTGPVKMLELRRLYECGRCKHRCSSGAGVLLGLGGARPC